MKVTKKNPFGLIINDIASCKPISVVEKSRKSQGKSCAFGQALGIDLGLINPCEVLGPLSLKEIFNAFI